VNTFVNQTPAPITPAKTTPAPATPASQEPIKETIEINID
jgi:hypothetical protein